MVVWSGRVLQRFTELFANLWSGRVFQCWQNFLQNLCYLLEWSGTPAFPKCRVKVLELSGLTVKSKSRPISTRKGAFHALFVQLR